MTEGRDGTIRYTIGEAADILGVSVPTLRLYEREGLILPQRKKSRHRLFTDADLERVRCIRHTITGKKVSIAGIKHLLSLIPCWKIRDCPDQDRLQCAAFINSESPCWAVSHRVWKCRTADCRTCPVYADLSDCSTLKQTIAAFTIDSPTPEPPEDIPQ